jgi:hypothetical protein
VNKSVLLCFVYIYLLYFLLTLKHRIFIWYKACILKKSVNLVVEKERRTLHKMIHRKYCPIFYEPHGVCCHVLIGAEHRLLPFEVAYFFHLVRWKWATSNTPPCDQVCIKSSEYCSSGFAKKSTAYPPANRLSVQQALLRRRLKSIVSNSSHKECLLKRRRYKHQQTEGQVKEFTVRKARKLLKNAIATVSMPEV